MSINFIRITKKYQFFIIVTFIMKKYKLTFLGQNETFFFLENGILYCHSEFKKEM